MYILISFILLGYYLCNSGVLHRKAEYKKLAAKIVLFEK
jgi:hypothetical protein